MSMIVVDEKLYFNLWTHKQAYSIFFFNVIINANLGGLLRGSFCGGGV